MIGKWRGYHITVDRRETGVTLTPYKIEKEICEQLN